MLFLVARCLYGLLIQRPWPTLLLAVGFSLLQVNNINICYLCGVFFHFLAGGFIYIATVSVIPELLEQSSTAQSLREIFAIFAGIFMMYLIAMYE